MEYLGIRLTLLTAVFVLGLWGTPASGAAIELIMEETSWEIKPGLITKAWTYNGTVPGQPIIVSLGDKISIKGINRLPIATTNIHWHGLRVPNDQDGPARVIKPQDAFTYEFTVRDTGSYWYHSHFRPVLDQVDMGLYAPFVVKAPEDGRYSGDHVLMFDDWLLDSDGKRLPGTGRGNMERYGTLETVNGKTGEAVPSIEVAQGELHKLRFYNASTAVPHTLHVEGHSLRVTHTDGRRLPEPYVTDSVTLHPGERYDVELEAKGNPGETYLLLSDRPEMGIKVPIVYQKQIVGQVKSPVAVTPSRGFQDIEQRKNDYVLVLNSRMKTDRPSGMNTGGGNMMAGMNHGSMGNNSAQLENMTDGMEWTINGEIFPNVPPIETKVGELVKVRLVNNDTMGMHAMDHPIHLHGGYFQVISLNGKAPERETFKDTINVPAGEFVEIAFAIEEPGIWMLHCHILDHEDGGMMMTVLVEK